MMKYLKQISKYLLIFILGFIVGFCIMYRLANNVVMVTRDYIWAESCYRHNLGVFNDSVADIMNSAKQIMLDSIDTPEGRKYKKALDRFREVTPSDRNCIDSDRFYLFGYM